MLLIVLSRGCFPETTSGQTVPHDVLRKTRTIHGRNEPLIVIEK